VADARVAGAVARVELHDSEGGVIQVELGRDAYARLAAEAGERVYVTPRQLRVFPSGGQPMGIAGPLRQA
jgi:hypothetical protein